MSASRVKEKKNHLHGLGFFLKLAECDGPPRPITLLNLMKINSFKNILKISILRIIFFFYKTIKHCFTFLCDFYLFFVKFCFCTTFFLLSSCDYKKNRQKKKNPR